MKFVRKAGLLLFIAAVFFATWWVSRYYFQFGRRSSLIPGVPVFLLPDGTASGQLSAPSEVDVVSYVLEPFVTNLRVPWSLVFTSPTRLLVTERPGRIRVIENGKLLPDPIRVFSEVSNRSEEGLMGMALDPNYERNRFVYLCIAYESGDHTADKIVRVVDQGSSLVDDTVLLADIPAANFHAGCRIRFGPDGKLYVSTGDATNKKLPQDVGSLGGKILRLNSDGSFPTDNPFPNSPVWSFGHRNPQGFDWHPESGILVETEHGPSGVDGPGGGDEVNIIERGRNYGWPIVSHEQSRENMVSPLLIFTPAVAPASGMFYRGSVFPQLKNSFLFGLLRGEGIMQVVFDAQEPKQVVSYQKLSGIEIGRVRDIVEGSDGYIYITTSNQDGRGEPREGDDAIYRMVPAKK